MGKHVTINKRHKTTKSYCDNKSKPRLVVKQQVDSKLYNGIKTVLEYVMWIGLIAFMLHLNITVKS